jgi:hypothetical protein
MIPTTFLCFFKRNLSFVTYLSLFRSRNAPDPRRFPATRAASKVRMHQFLLPTYTTAECNSRCSAMGYDFYDNDTTGRRLLRRRPDKTTLQQRHHLRHLVAFSNDLTTTNLDLDLSTLFLVRRDGDECGRAWCGESGHFGPVVIGVWFWFVPWTCPRRKLWDVAWSVASQDEMKCVDPVMGQDELVCKACRVVCVCSGNRGVIQVSLDGS